MSTSCPQLVIVFVSAVCEIGVHAHIYVILYVLCCAYLLTRRDARPDNHGCGQIVNIFVIVVIVILYHNRLRHCRHRAVTGIIVTAVKVLVEKNSRCKSCNNIGTSY